MGGLMLPLAPAFALDLETTSGVAARARPVEISAVLIDGGELSGHYTERCNPGRALLDPAFEGASAIHGITLADLEGAPSDSAVLEFLRGELQGRAVVTYNGEAFDLQVVPELRTGPSVDVFRLLTKLAEESPHPSDASARLPHPEGLAGLRLSLSMIYAALCGERLEGAHGATVDAVATARVLEQVLLRWGGYLEARLGALSWETLAGYTATPPAGWSDWKGTLRRNARGDFECRIRPHQGVPLRRLPRDFLRWMLSRDFAESTKELLRLELQG